jgi:hypothetical protein
MGYGYMVSRIFPGLVHNGIGIGNQTFIDKNTLVHETISEKKTNPALLLTENLI